MNQEGSIMRAEKNREGSIMRAEKNQEMEQSVVTRLLIAGGAIGPLLFIIVLLIEGATRPGYSAWHNYGSSLSLGPGGWMQIANFIVCGLLTLCFAIGLRQVFRTGRGSVWGPILLGVFGVGLMVAGVFVTDPGLGYPPGTHTSCPQSFHGTMLGVNAIFTFGSLAIACFVLASRFAGDANWKGWALYSVVTGVLMVGSFIGSAVVSALDEGGVLPGSPTGLIQ